MGKRPRVVIVGAGFGGLSAARALRKADVRITVIDRANHHLFQPLLYQVATAGLSPANIAVAIRKILDKQENARVLLAEATGIDAARNVLTTSEGEIEFDYLILAPGAGGSYFGHPEWEAIAPSLKTIDDATRIRRSVLISFEKAEVCKTEAEQKPWLTFVIVGAGPTGVEMAGSIAELAHHTLPRDFDNLDLRKTRIVLIEAGQRVLSSFPEESSAAAERSLASLGVEVQLNTTVTQVSEEGVTTSRGAIEARTIIWAAGVEAVPVARWLGAEFDRLGRTVVGADLSVPKHPNISVIGDCSHSLGENGQPLPGVAQVAIQQGKYVAEAIRLRENGLVPKPFRYHDKGSMATIGRSSAVAVIGRLRLAGFVAWIAWLLIHLMSLVGHRNRVLVFLQWFWAYVFWDRGARLITPIAEKRQ